MFIVQELMDADLDCVLQNTELEMEHVRLFSYQLLRALKFIHSAFIIHRDIQLTNVLVNVDTLMLKVSLLRCLIVVTLQQFYFKTLKLNQKLTVMINDCLS